MQKIWQFYKNNLLVCTLSVSAVLLFFSSLWEPLLYVMLAYLYVSMIFFTPEQIFCSIFCILSFSGVLKLFISSAIYTFLVLLVKYIIDVCRKKQKIYKLPLILTAAIIVIFSAIFYGTNDYGALQGVLIVGIFLFIYLAFAYRTEISARKCFKYLIYGLIASVIMGAILYVIPQAQFFAFRNWNYGMITVKAKIFANKRLELLSFHVNHLYALSVMAISFSVYMLLNREKKSIWQIGFYIVSIIIAVAVGALTLSKAFLVLFGMIVILTLIASIVVYKKHALKVIIPVLVLSGVLALIFKDKFKIILDRFFSKSNTGDEEFDILLNQMTTGRLEIWKKFLKETFSTPWKALFGLGLFTKDIVDVGPHSLYISIIYRHGILGTILLCVLIWSYARSAGKLKCSFLGLMPLIIFIFMGMQEACLDERLYFMLIAVMLAFSAAPKQQSAGQVALAMAEEGTASQLVSPGSPSAEAEELAAGTEKTNEIDEKQVDNVEKPSISSERSGESAKQPIASKAVKRKSNAKQSTSSKVNKQKGNTKQPVASGATKQKK